MNAEAQSEPQLGPGVYLGKDVKYGAIEAVNQSTLKKMQRSALSYQHAVSVGWKETASQFRGTAAHTAILEPMQFMREYVIWEDGDRRGKAWNKFKEANSNKRILKPNEYDEAVAKRDAVLSHPVAGPLLQGGKLDIEATMVWDDAETGIRCKGRVDAIRRSDNLIIDLKASRNAEPFWFGRDAHRFGYHWQAAFYLDGLQAASGQQARFALVVVEQNPPHEVVVYELPDEVVELGREEYRDALQKLAECRETNVWPGMATLAPVPLSLPPWAFGGEGDDIGDLGLEF